MSCKKLKFHVKGVHEKIKDEQCDECQYTTSYRSQLKQCPYQAMSGNKLKFHVKGVHEKIKDEKCYECPYTTSFVLVILPNTLKQCMKKLGMLCAHDRFLLGVSGLTILCIWFGHPYIKVERSLTLGRSLSIGETTGSTKPDESNTLKSVLYCLIKIRNHNCPHCPYQAMSEHKLYVCHEDLFLSLSVFI